MVRNILMILYSMELC